MMKTSIKREQSQAGLSFAERENRRSLAGGESNFRPQVKNKLLLLLALLMTAATGAWGQNSTTYNVTFGGFAESEMNTTVNVTSLPYTFTAIGDDAFYPWTVISTSGNIFYNATVTSGGEGKVSANIANYDEMTITITGPFEGTATIHVTGEDDENRSISTDITVTCVAVGGASSGDSGDQTYSVTMKDGVKDADKWTVKVGEGQAQALPIGGLKGDGSETVTLQYNGRLKVKSVKAVKKAPAPAEGKTYTNLKGGEVLHVGDKITETEGTFRSTHNDNPQESDYYTYLRSGKTYEVLRADVVDYKYTESPNGQYYVLKCTYFDYDDYEDWVTDYYFVQDLPVTGTSDGITVTLDGQDGYGQNLYTFWVHEPNQAAPAETTVTWNNNDITGSGKSFTKDGVTITAGDIDFGEKNFMQGGTFTTTLGNFTKIEVTAGFFMEFSGTGWSGSNTKQTWTGNASSVPFSGDIMGMGGIGGNVNFVFTIEPKN